MPLFSTSKLLATVLAAGWLAEALAGKNSDVEAGIAAYNAGDHEAALAAYAAAEAELGERPEIFYDRGLALVAKGDKDEARKAFERGTESTNPDVHASSEYELGNLDLDAEAFDPAIEHYIKCLKARPDHANAKWNLELALLKKKQKEEEEKKKQEEDKKNQDENKDEENKDEQKQDEEKKDEEKKDEEKKDEQKQDEEKKDEQKQDEQKQDEQKQDEQKQDEQKQDEQKEKGEQPQPQPQPQPQLDKADLDKALEQLDAEDNFQLDRPARQIRVEKDW
ncbi:tetratricopeptide repeat protein [Nannocystis radixulma]|uniref:Tetratricopeptide repeat protein n=1 Tax=Nannocystis radixulma TaxID=2995305 RepID=A0ABT5AW70_9BACT|nr:tetratricopeptide repeat protein [Nannocystis radixulma]MDC0666102.1 tetratricopeptide repeat protein [Nannocystis radixulma]